MVIVIVVVVVFVVIVVIVIVIIQIIIKGGRNTWLTWGESAGGWICWYPQLGGPPGSLACTSRGRQHQARTCLGDLGCNEGGDADSAEGSPRSYS